MLREHSPQTQSDLAQVLLIGPGADGQTQISSDRY